jgi:hypothetical protein
VVARDLPLPTKISTTINKKVGKHVCPPYLTFLTKIAINSFVHEKIQSLKRLTNSSSLLSCKLVCAGTYLAAAQAQFPAPQGGGVLLVSFSLLSTD